MKKLFLFVAIALVSVISNVNAQNISKDIVGTWDLATLEIQGDTANADEVFENKLSQQYMADGGFIGRAGDEVAKGTYTLSSDKKTIHVNVPNQSLDFKVIRFETDRMKLEAQVNGDTVTFYYAKQ